jgi:two-component system, sensor histidine kinase and response regulator
MNNQILVVEDNDTLRAIMVMQLKRLGFSASSASNGNAAVAEFTAGTFRLIMMDVQMPIMDGMEACRAIRKIELQEARSRVTIVAVTANPNRERCYNAGMDDFLFKPALLGSIRDMLARWIVPDAA